jgi:hypothetical protein
MSFTPFAPDDSVVSSDASISPMWTGDVTTLLTYYSSSAQESSNAGKFYLDVYQTSSSDLDAVVQFSVAYGHISGSGSAYFNAAVPSKTPTRDIFGQFRTLIYGDENSSFTFGSSTVSSKDIIVLSVNRTCFKESFNPGSMTLTLGTGSAVLKLTDDSTVTTAATYIGTSRVYQLLSGSFDSVYSTNYTVSGSYGIMIPDEGLVILNPRALALSVGALGGLNVTWNEDSSTTVASANPSYNYNNRKVYELLTTGANFRLQNYETISSRYFFVRVKNAEDNYTTNPTVIDSNGNLLYTSLIYNPQTYITTVGLYNTSGDLVAVAKLNKPLVKDFTKELLLRVKLDF